MFGLSTESITKGKLATVKRFECCRRFERQPFVRARANAGLSPPSREDNYPPFSNLGDYHPLAERIIISLFVTWRIMTPQRGLPPLSQKPGGLSFPRQGCHLSHCILGIQVPKEDYQLLLSTKGAITAPLQISDLQLPYWSISSFTPFSDKILVKLRFDCIVGAMG